MASIAAMRRVASRDFLLLWFAEAISGFGDRITAVALAFVAWELTHSAVPTALAFLTWTLGFGLFGFFGGAIADALGHRRAMITCDVARALLIGAIPTSLLLGGPLVVAYVLVFIATLFSAIFTPAKFAIVPSVVPKEALSTSNSLLFASDRTVEIVGVVIAGALVAVFGVFAFFIDALSFVGSALVLTQLPARDSPTERVAWRGIVNDVPTGLRALWSDATLRSNTIYALLAQLSIPVFNSLLPVLVFRDYGLGPEYLGVAQGAIAVGAVSMGLGYSALLGGLRQGTAITFGFALFGCLLLVISTLPGFIASLPILALVGVANVVFLVANVTLLQERTLPTMRARVFGARLALRNLTWLPVIAITATIADSSGAGVALALAGSFTLIVVVIGTLFSVVRNA